MKTAEDRIAEARKWFDDTVLLAVYQLDPHKPVATDAVLDRMKTTLKDRIVALGISDDELRLCVVESLLRLAKAGFLDGGTNEDHRG